MNQRQTMQTNRCHHNSRKLISRAKRVTINIVGLLLFSQKFVALANSQQQQQQQSSAFPGVTQDLAWFCSGRPSLSVDLAPMVVSTKSNTSFNYKIYLFSDQHVFQTGQIVPRDDFRIHSFPVKFKRLDEFWLTQNTSKEQTHEESRANNNKLAEFNLNKFLSLVPISGHNEHELQGSEQNVGPESTNKTRETNIPRAKRQTKSPSAREDKRTEAYRSSLADGHGDALPGDDETFGTYNVEPADDKPASSEIPNVNSNLNEHIEFDRDDQVSVLAPTRERELIGRRSSGSLHQMNTRERENGENRDTGKEEKLTLDQTSQTVLPVGSFSSFHANLAYLVRKDFGQREPELIKIQIDANKFEVTQTQVITINRHNKQTTTTNVDTQNDYAFLNHKLLRDPDTRITSISQIYEQWITRNFFTIVYIQRKSEQEQNDDGRESIKQREIVTNRLVFRGSSMVLLGAEQLDYVVKASAFITEKNGLHYYLEFLSTGKFYLAAIDWSKRPFRIIDSRQYQIKTTRTQFDNEELLLCPPAVCFSSRPIDEIVAYGRIPIAHTFQMQAKTLASSTGATSHNTQTLPKTVFVGHWRSQSLNQATTLRYNSTSDLLASVGAEDRNEKPPEQVVGRLSSGASISLDELVDAIKLGSASLDVSLHLRDWVWSLAREYNQMNKHGTNSKLRLKSDADLFAWRYERAKRNEIKPLPDTYGFALTGFDIDASYRVYNELYLISSNRLITINYTLANETVTSSQQLGDEFQGLSSSLLDPITGAFYDRYSNHIYFFKGDRYIGYDYATKKPLEDFQLPPPAMILPTGDSSIMPTTSQILNQRQQQLQPSPLVSSLPVASILGRQHQVDAIYHDFHSDIVYIFTGMKFYTFPAIKFKDGSFQSDKQLQAPTMLCINENFLKGCQFDQAFPNPCVDELDSIELVAPTLGSIYKQQQQQQLHVTDADKQLNVRNKSSAILQADPEQPKATISPLPEGENNTEHDYRRGSNFDQQQQTRLRTIVARGSGLLDYLVSSTLAAGKVGQPANTVDHVVAQSDWTIGSPEHLVVIYMIIAIAMITVVVTITMIWVIICWTRSSTEQKPGLNKRNENDSELQRYHDVLVGPYQGGATGFVGGPNMGQLGQIEQDELTLYRASNGLNYLDPIYDHTNHQDQQHHVPQHQHTKRHRTASQFFLKNQLATYPQRPLQTKHRNVIQPSPVAISTHENQLETPPPVESHSHLNSSQL